MSTKPTTRKKNPYIICTIGSYSVTYCQVECDRGIKMYN